MAEDTVLFRKAGGSERLGENVTEIKEKYVALVNRTGGVVEVKIRAPQEESMDAYEFFENINDMEPLSINIANAGEMDHYYFRGVSGVKEETGDKGNTIYAFTATLQTVDASPR